MVPFWKACVEMEMQLNKKAYYLLADIQTSKESPTFYNENNTIINREYWRKATTFAIWILCHLKYCYEGRWCLK